MSPLIPVIILGSGGHALVIWDILESLRQFNVIGFTDPLTPRGTVRTLGKERRPILGDDNVLDEYLAKEENLHVIAGMGPEPEHIRKTAIAKIASFGRERLLTVIHPSTSISASVRLGHGTVIMAGAVVNPNTSIGNHCVVNTGATVDHECEIQDNVFIQPGAHVAGRVVVEEDAIVGLGAGIREKVRIGRRAFVGGGAFVARDIAPGAVVVGVPARV